MKKLTSLLLILVMVVSVLAFSSCSKSTKEILSASMEKLNNANAGIGKMEMQLEMSVMGIETDTKMTCDFKMTDMKTQTPKISMKATTEVMSMSQEMNIYSDGSFVYMDMLGMKMKVPLESEDAADFDVSGMIDDLAIDIPDEIVEETEYTVNDNGDYVISFEFTAEQFMSLFNELAEELGEEGGDFALKGAVKYEIVVSPELVIKSIKIDIPFAVTVEGQTAETKAVYLMEFSSFEDSITVDVPTDLEQYTDISQIG